MGTVLGLVLGVIVASNAEPLRAFISGLTNIPIFPPEVFFLSTLPSKIDAGEVTVVALSGAGAELPGDALSGLARGAVRPGRGAAL